MGLEYLRRGRTRSPPCLLRRRCKTRDWASLPGRCLLRHQPLETVREAAPHEPHYRRVRLVVAVVPASKFADAHWGILQPLAQVTDNLTFTLTLDVTSEEGGGVR